MRFFLWVFFGIILSTTAYGQDISNFTQFFINPYTLNPSYAGIEGRTALFAGYRKQWSSIDGAPVIANFSLHTPLSSKLNFGFSATSDKRGIAQVSAAMLTIGYTAVIDNTTSVRFGLSAGYGSNAVDLTSASSTVTSDPALKTLLSNNSFLIGNAGVSFHKSTFHGGITMPNIFQPVYLSKDAFNVTALKPFQSIVIHAKKKQRRRPTQRSWPIERNNSKSWKRKLLTTKRNMRSCWQNRKQSSWQKIQFLQRMRNHLFRFKRKIPHEVAPG